MAYSFLDLAKEVLKASKHPLLYQQIWDIAVSTGLAKKLKSKGKTPWESLGSRLYVDVRDNENSPFIKVGKRPTRFFLKDRQEELSESLLKTIEIQEAKKPAPKTPYHERDFTSTFGLLRLC